MPRTHCRNGVSLQQAWYGPTNTVTASAMNTLQGVLRVENKIAEARALLERVLTVQDASHGPIHAKVALALSGLGYIALTSKHYGEAEHDFQRELEIYRKLYGDHHASVAAALSGLAGVAQDRGDDAKSEVLLRQALAIYLEAVGPDHRDTGIAPVRLGHTLLSEKKHSAAIKETLLGNNILIKQTPPQNEFLQKAQKDLAAENSHLNP
jgi:tetratricopeptide (TPR) repeat protein